MTLVAPEIAPFVISEKPANWGDTVTATCTMLKGDSPIQIEWALNGETDLPRLSRYIDRDQQARQLADDRRGHGESRRGIYLCGQQRRWWNEFHRDFGREWYNTCSLSPSVCFIFSRCMRGTRPDSFPPHPVRVTAHQTPPPPPPHDPFVSSRNS